MADFAVHAWPVLFLAAVFLLGRKAWRDAKQLEEADRRADAKAAGWDRARTVVDVFDFDNESDPAWTRRVA